MPGLLRRVVDDDAGLDCAALEFEIPVAAERRIPSRVDARCDICTRDIRQEGDGCLAFLAFAIIAAVDQDVRRIGQVLFDSSKVIGILALHVVAG